MPACRVIVRLGSVACTFTASLQAAVLLPARVVYELK